MEHTHTRTMESFFGWASWVVWLFAGEIFHTKLEKEKRQSKIFLSICFFFFFGRLSCNNRRKADDFFFAQVDMKRNPAVTHLLGVVHVFLYKNFTKDTKYFFSKFLCIGVRYYVTCSIFCFEKEKSKIRDARHIKIIIEKNFHFFFSNSPPKKNIFKLKKMWHDCEGGEGTIILCVSTTIFVVIIIYKWGVGDLFSQ